MRQLIPLSLLCVLALAACDNPVAQNKVEYRSKNLKPQLAATDGTIPVVFQASPGGNVDAYILQALSQQAQQSGLGNLRFAETGTQPIENLTIEVAYQPDRTKTGISLCQQKQIGGQEKSENSIVVAVAICRDGRRLSSVRGVDSLPGDTDGNVETMTALINGLTKALLGS